MTAKVCTLPGAVLLYNGLHGSDADIGYLSHHTGNTISSIHVKISGKKNSDETETR